MTDILQSATSVVTTVTGFLEKHVGDLNNIASVLSELVNVAPLDSQDKSRITNVIGAVQSSADNINNWLQNNQVSSGGEVVVKESDLVAALDNFFATDAGKAALASAAHSNG